MSREPSHDGPESYDLKGATSGDAADPDTGASGRSPVGEFRVTNNPGSYRWLREEMGQRGLPYFRRGRDVVHTPSMTQDGYREPERKEDDNGPAVIATVSVTRLKVDLDDAYDIYRIKEIATEDGTRRITEPVTFPTEPAQMALEAASKGQAPNVPVLRGVIHTPIVRRDGSILATPGYDAETGMLLLPTVDVPAVPERPTRVQVAAALALLCKLVDQFKWATVHDEANWLGYLLTPLLRLVTPPPYKLFAIMARQAGSGKSLLAEVIRIVHGGVFRSEMPHDDAEMAKSLTSILATTTAPVVQFDNVGGVLKSSRLDGLLTSPVYTDRILGATKDSPILPNDRIWIITGNNLRLGADTPRRTIWATIDPGVPNPHLRTGFRLHLPSYVAERRGEILHALLVLIVAWIAEGDTELPTGDSYTRWITAVRRILAHAEHPGVFDHADSIQQTVGEEDEGWADFLEFLHGSRFGGHSFLMKEIVAAISPKLPRVWSQEEQEFVQPTNPLYVPDLGEALPGTELLGKHRRGDNIAGSLGKWFDNRKGKFARGYSVAAGTKGRAGVPWTITYKDPDAEVALP